MIYGDRSNTDGMARAGTVVPRAPVRKVVDTILSYTPLFIVLLVLSLCPLLHGKMLDCVYIRSKY
jgi:hypothetical protein